MIRITVIDLETNEVKLNKDVNAVVVGASYDDGTVGAGVGKPLELAFAYRAAADAMTDIENDNPELKLARKIIKAVESIDEGNDADE